MNKLNKSIKTLFFISLGLSIGFPLGIICIVFGATKGLIPLLVLGIILTVAGFYVMPLLWMKYADKRQYRSLMNIIENEHIYTVRDLSNQTGYTENRIRDMIKYLINSAILRGYLFRNDTLEVNANIKQTAKNATKIKCDNCSAFMVFDGVKYVCEYCGYVQTKEE